ncbi:MAG: hypothetical protein M9960_08155 [Xanthomonadaceae bacterium]|nr:hypothetical protein [Xanthomonadaceae bacterium]
MRYIASVILALVSPLVFSQEQAPPEPATKLEAFQATTGTVVVRGYTTAGTVRGLGGVITVDAREFRDASNLGKRVTGISISVKETSRLERENTSFIDAEEIESLLQGLEYIGKATKEVTSFENFEAEYRTKGDFRVTAFNDNSGQLNIAVSSGRIGKSTAYLKAPQLQELKAFVEAARAKL